MERINLIEVDTRWGYKAFELYRGHIPHFDAPVDLLAVSVLVGDYYPQAGTVIGALHDICEIDLKDLLEDPEFDLREAFGCWVSKEIPGSNFSRLLCVEMFSPGLSIEETIQNVFVALSVLEAKGIEIHEFAVPLLGTGSLGLDPASVIRPLLEYSLEYLQRSLSLRRVMFVVHDQERASQLSEAMNDALGRVRVVLPRGEFVERTRQRIASQIQASDSVLEKPRPAVFDDLFRIVSNQDSRSFELGIAARRCVEFIANDILMDDRQNTLFAKLERIRKSSDLGIAEWIIMYMHVLRVLGNEAAHEADAHARVPPIVDETDLELCLLCVRRLLNFWLDFKKATSSVE